jgi:hypothetical protein
MCGGGGTRGGQNGTNSVLTEHVGFPVPIVIPPLPQSSLPLEMYRGILSRRSSEILIVTAFHRGTKRKRCAVYVSEFRLGITFRDGRGGLKDTDTW